MSELVGNVSIHKINKRITAFQGFNPFNSLFDVNAAIIVSNDDDLVIFVDSGFNPSCAKVMWKYVKKSYDDMKKMEKYLILTHHHFDHSFGMNYFKTQGVNIIAHRKIARYLDTKKYVEAALTVRFPTNIPKSIYSDVELSIPDILIKDDFVVPNSEIEILMTPGHSADSISVYDTKSKVLIPGDSLYSQPTSPTIPMERVSEEIYLETLEKLRKKEIDLVIPGHGNIIKEF